MVPLEPEPSEFHLPGPSADDGDVVAVGGDLSPGTILQAYRKGLFPMHLPDGQLGWWSPVDRAVLPRVLVSRSLRASMRRFHLTVDREFEAVVAGCAGPERAGAWITQDVADAYLSLHRLGWAHSIEVWDGNGNLAGGLYGVGIGGLFAGESMFHRQRDASKVALVHLLEILDTVPGSLLDVQWSTPHLASLGAVVIGREAYLAKLPEVLDAASPW